MHPTLITIAFAAALALPTAALADRQACCEGHTHTQTHACAMPCCQPGEPIDTIELLMQGNDMAAPARQYAVVSFKDPVLVGSKFLMGKYVIEHDTDRQARGEPCTHVYALNDQLTPIAAFHCTHLDAQPDDRNLVTLRRRVDGTLELVSFQFARENAAHAYPAR
jgi:hypothetical protein